VLGVAAVVVVVAAAVPMMVLLPAAALAVTPPPTTTTTSSFASAFTFTAASNRTPAKRRTTTAAAASTALRSSSSDGMDDDMDGATVVVCVGSTCGPRGGKKNVAKFEELAEASGKNVKIDTFSCVSDCAECGLGPNVEVRKKNHKKGAFYPIVNNVKTEDDMKKVLGIN